MQFSEKSRNSGALSASDESQTAPAVYRTATDIRNLKRGILQDNLAFQASTASKAFVPAEETLDLEMLKARIRGYKTLRDYLALSEQNFVEERICAAQLESFTKKERGAREAK